MVKFNYVLRLYGANCCVHDILWKEYRFETFRSALECFRVNRRLLCFTGWSFAIFDKDKNCLFRSPLYRGRTLTSFIRLFRQDRSIALKNYLSR